jgi:uncharacterized protein (DUF433 family)
MTMVALARVTHRDPDILNGSLVFVGTRVPVRSLFDYLEGGESLDEFLHQFPSVKREFAIAVLDAAYDTMAADAHTA